MHMCMYNLQVQLSTLVFLQKHNLTLKSSVKHPTVFTAKMIIYLHFTT